jgi:ABC-type branched-subunit amino acid transport system ATPase component
MPTSPGEADPAARGLTIIGVSAGYGANLVVREASLTIRPGEIVAVVGPNGSGKSTLLKAVTGGVPVRGGRVELDGVDVTRLERHVLARRGVAYLPQDNDVFRSLSVRENLELGGHQLRRAQTATAVQRVLERFPRLAGMQSRAAGRLSGGERRMLAIGRILMLRPIVALLDEPSVGLSPPASRALLEETVPALAAAGAAVLLVEQRAMQALQIADRACVMVAGRIVRHGLAAEIGRQEDIGDLFLGAEPSH